jgi:hypothetical protein
MVHQAIIQYMTNPEDPYLGEHEDSKNETICPDLPFSEGRSESKTQERIKCLRITNKANIENRERRGRENAQIQQRKQPRDTSVEVL